MDAGQPQIWPEAPNNRAFDWEVGNKEKADALFASAAKVVKITIENNRVIVASMEARVSLAAFDAATGRFTLYVPTQGVWVQKNVLSKILGVEPSRSEEHTSELQSLMRISYAVFCLK